MATMVIVEQDRLFRQQSRVKEIRNLLNEIENIASKLSAPSGMRITDMPRSRNPFDKVGMLISRKIEKEKRLDKLTKEATKEAKVLEDVISLISELPETPQGASNSDYQDFLRYHFLHAMDMKEILELSGVDEFSDNYDSQLRLLYTRRFEALKKFTKCQKI